jgi:hypothetical protein
MNKVTDAALVFVPGGTIAGHDTDESQVYIASDFLNVNETVYEVSLFLMDVCVTLTLPHSAAPSCKMKAPMLIGSNSLGVDWI